MPSLNPPLEPHQALRCGGSAPLIRGTCAGQGVGRRDRFPRQRRGRIGHRLKHSRRRRQRGRRLAARKRPRGQRLGCVTPSGRRACGHTRDPRPGARQELPLAGRHPAPRRGLVAVCPPRTSPLRTRRSRRPCLPPLSAQNCAATDQAGRRLPTGSAAIPASTRQTPAPPQPQPACAHPTSAGAAAPSQRSSRAPALDLMPPRLGETGVPRSDPVVLIGWS